MAENTTSTPEMPITGGNNSTIPATNQTTTTSNSTYDYIIAGAGPAGLIAVGRFTESGASVLLIERGVYDVPALGYYLLSMVDGSTYCTDTASQGGGSMTTALMFAKPQDADFNDKWPADWKAKDPHISTEPWNIHNYGSGGPVKTYLPLVQDLTNLNLMLNTKVIRAVRNGTWVSGVEVEKQDGNREIIEVTPNTGKVLLAAGALSTPRTLFYIGISPAIQIKKVPASVKLPSSAQWIHFPVGERPKDHPIITLNLSTNSSFATLDSTAFTSAGNDSISIVILDTAGNNTQFSGSPWLQTQGDIDSYDIFLDRVTQMSNKPGSGLAIQLSDRSNASAGITGAELLADLNSTLVTGAHYVGTAKMGNDDGRIGNGISVVDIDTKVYGTDNLLVVDASMHPDLPTGNTQAIVMVAAEKAVEKILALDGLTIGDGVRNGTADISRGGKTGLEPRSRPHSRPLRCGPGYMAHYGHSLIQRKT
ncbi:hypothetical protein F5X99DRAFT_404551 [Biscogniauxia marginata]|nr:hypothetical protein F5X99DRAFT_404551 [Biscogniauxia marginata]